MHITEAEALLRGHNIPFETAEYADENTFYRQNFLFTNAHCTERLRVKALTVYSPNGHRNIVLQFTETNGEFEFVDLYFGGFCFELFALEAGNSEAEEKPETVLLEMISDITAGDVSVIEAYDLKKKKRLGNRAFYGAEDEAAYQNKIKRIGRPKGFFGRLFKTETLYEIFNWNEYNKIVR